MNKESILKETEKFMRENIPASRITKKGSKKPYLNHVLGCKKYALILSEIYKADKFIVEIASLLHDIGATAGQKHAQESARISKEFLSRFNIPDDIKNRILKCIERHSMSSKTETIEEQIIKDADGIIFIEDSYKDFFEDRKQKLPLREAKKISIKKTKGMRNKIKIDEGIKIAEKFLPKAIDYLNNQ
jgi:HD superfamily phosphodiesterase